MKTTNKRELLKKNQGHLPLWYELAHIKGIIGKILFLIYALMYRRKTSFLVTLAFYEGDGYKSTKFFYKTFQVTSNWKTINFADIWEQVEGEYNEEDDEFDSTQRMGDFIPKTDGRWEVIMIHKLSRFQTNTLYGSGVIDQFILDGQLTRSKPFCWIKDNWPKLNESDMVWWDSYNQKKSKAKRNKQEELKNECGGLYDNDDYWER